MLEFEHIIQINDPSQPAIPFISREILWDALVFRARCPGRFNDSLSCHVDAEMENGFVRILRVGDQEMRDEVTLVPLQEIRTSLYAGQDGLQAESLVRIEEPAPGSLFLRFIYKRDSVAGGPDYDDMLKSAYLHMDRDAIRQIRQWLAAGWDPQQPWQ